MGNRVEITGISMSTVAEARIVEYWTNFDALGMMQQLGLIPKSGEWTRS
jgi:predicted ester cyclase